MPSKDVAEESFKYNFIFMKVFGLYPFDSYPKLFKPYAFTCYVVFTIIPPILSLIQLIVSRETDLEVMTQNGFMMIELMAVIFKMLPCKINSEGIRRTIYALNQDAFTNNLADHDLTLSNMVRNCRTLFIIFLVDYGAAVTGWNVIPLGYSEKRFPFVIWLPFDPTENTALYWCVYSYIALAIVHGGMDNLALDTLIACLMYHAAGQIKILKKNLMDLSGRTNNVSGHVRKAISSPNNEELIDDIIYQKICRCIEHYDAISDFVKDIEDTYSPVLFSQFIFSMIVIGISIAHLSIAVIPSVPFMTTSIFCTAITGELFLHCFAGSLLFEESKTIGDAIFMSEWYLFDEKCKRALSILIERTKRPIMVTAGKLMEVSLDTFTIVMRKAYSILAVLKN